jgi:hypothetical protein
VLTNAQRRDLKQYAKILCSLEDERAQWVGEQLDTLTSESIKRKPLQQRSAKHRKLMRRRSAMIKDLIESYGNRCELGEYLRLRGVDSACWGVAEGMHELHRRSQRGGVSRVAYLTDPELALLACNVCNGWVEDNITTSIKLGVAVNFWVSTDDAKILVKKVRESIGS